MDTGVGRAVGVKEERRDDGDGILGNPVSNLREFVERDVAGRCHNHAHVEKGALEEQLLKDVFLRTWRWVFQQLSHAS